MQLRILQEMTVFGFPLQSTATNNTEQRTRRSTQAKTNNNSIIMKLPLLLLPILLLPSVMADLTVKILVPDIWKETTIVWGKNTSEGVPLEQSRAKNDLGSKPECPEWIVTHCKTKYAGVTDITFSKPMVDPRPINITMGSELFQVSLKLDGVFTAEAIVLYHFATRHREHLGILVY